MKIKTCFFFFFSETTGPFITKFHRKIFRNKKMQINKYEFGHIRTVAAMPVYGKIIKKTNKQKKKKKKKKKKKLFLRNQGTDCLETWYVVLGSRGSS